ncbi:MAG: response regulator [Xanthomonadaceae bacterium]|nr:response regulator [Xanthomonadaceae bacterium]MDE1885346.1 response regulator [Xanthomonadaceae bacterium]MDE1961545.1 response regulator [Xanthomonadaceae bacterium]MDE2083436.1 response regulator [Xanthomonadaceae bacterium]MDE2257998.1 response regulator [Xanthomonadaceae bacterium]
MKKSALLIEDNEQNRYLATFLLEYHGYRVVAAEDGERGIELARELRPDLVLLDIQLPRMDGYAVASALRLIEALRDIPIIAVTSYAMMGDRERALDAGCNGYIEKPIDPATFAEQIAKIAAFANPAP